MMKKEPVKKKAVKKFKKVKAKAAKVRTAKAKTGKAKKPAKAKVSLPAPSPWPWRDALAGEIRIGVVDDFFGHISVIAFKLEKPLSIGDKIHVRGHTTDLTQTVDSMQIGHQAVAKANPGDAVGIKISDKSRKGDYVYKAL